MAENITDGILEEATDSPEQQQKNGLTTSLLTKIAIGMAVLLVVLIVLFFFLPRSAEPELSQSSPVNTAEPAEQTELVSADNEMAATIELPSIAGATVSPQTGFDSSKVQSQLVSLQQEINALRAQTASLNQRVELLVQENVTLENKLKSLSESTTADSMQVRHAVNTNSTPLFYHQEQFDHTQQLELEPKWGEFNHQLDSAKKR